ncbi:putative holin-like toxin [Paenibacillus elgii]
MPVEVKDVLALMISFGLLLIALLTLVVTIVNAINQNKKK